MNFVISRLDNFIIDEGEYQLPVREILSQNVKNLPDIYGSIIFPCDKKAAHVCFKPNRENHYLVNIYTLLEKMRFKEDFGNVAYRNIRSSPILCCLLPSSESEIHMSPNPDLLKQFDSFYQIINYNFQAMAIAFSMACWIVKDCCVTSTEFYQFNYINTYRVRNKIENIYTLSNGTIDYIYFNKKEIKKAINLTLLIYGYMLQVKKSETDILFKFDEVYLSGKSGGNATLNIEGLLNPENNSFCRALVFLQQARKSGYIIAKIEKYCSGLECLFAIQEKHKLNIKNITAAYIGDKGDELTIKNDMHDAFGIRSDFSHGDYIKYMKHHSEAELRELSQRIDQYVREVLTKIFQEPDKNYNLKTRNTIRGYFEKMAKEKYPGDYE